MEKKYHIFISSTYKDLKEERRIVMEQILNLCHIPIAMELFNASDESQWSYIEQQMTEADYYVLIVGERYGSEKDGLSYTEMEYDLAASRNVPIASFLLADNFRDNLPAHKVEFDKKSQINAFRDKVSKNRMVSYWSNAHELGMRVSAALPQLIRARPRAGWIRADQAMKPDTANEIARLSKENNDLRVKIETAHGSVAYAFDRLVSIHYNIPAGSLNVDELFFHIARKLVSGLSDDEIDFAILSVLDIDQIEFNNISTQKSIQNIRENVIIDLILIQLIEEKGRGLQKLYQLTTLGRQLAAHVLINGEGFVSVKT